MKTSLWIAALLAAALLSGCAVGPGYKVVVNPFDWTMPPEAAAPNPAPAVIARAP